MSTSNQKKRKPMSNDIPAANKRKKVGWETLEEYLEESNMQDASPALKHVLAMTMDFESFKIANRTLEQSKEIRKNQEEQDKKLAELSKGIAETRRQCQLVSDRLDTLEVEFATRRKEVDARRMGVSVARSWNERSVRDLQHAAFIPSSNSQNDYI